MKYFRWFLVSAFLFTGSHLVSINGQSFSFSHADSMIASLGQRYFEKGRGAEAASASGTDADMAYEYRFAELARRTPIPLVYNGQVRKYIDLFVTRRKPDFERMDGLSHYYFPMFEEILDRYDLPFEFKYLAVMESSLNPLAKSPTGAAGIWQFKLFSAQMFDLHVSSYIDERYDPVRSTEAACKYIEYLYRTFNDWLLVLAAYNGGPGEVRDAIQRAGGSTDFWTLQAFLPEQTRNYVPIFMATVYVMNYGKLHGLRSGGKERNYFDTDTVWVKQPVAFGQLASVLSLDEKELRYLNPIYRTGTIPADSLGNILRLPRREVRNFIANEYKIYGQVVKKDDFHSLKAKALDTTGMVKEYHVVARGEYFNKIALQYGVTADQIKAWNGASDNNLQPGQRLVIWRKDE